MAKILTLMTKESKLKLLDGRDHPSGFWAEEFVVPYERFRREGYDVEVTTIGGRPPSVDPTSLDPRIMGLTRPKGSPNRDHEHSRHFREVIDGVSELKKPLDVERLTREDVDRYAGVYFCGGHGAIGDLPKSDAVRMLARWVLDLGKPFAVVCHGHTGLLSLRDGESRWPFDGYRMTAFSHAEELVTDMAGQLPFVLQVELERLGARYERAPDIWGSHVVEDRTLITGQNPYSSTALAEHFVKRLKTAPVGART
jgi:putative intracellular protease/amidase